MEEEAFCYYLGNIWGTRCSFLCLGLKSRSGRPSTRGVFLEEVRVGLMRCGWIDRKIDTGLGLHGENNKTVSFLFVCCIVLYDTVLTNHIILLLITN